MGTSSKEEQASDADTSSGDAPPSDTSLFFEGERVLAYHGPRIYKAKARLSPLLFPFFISMISSYSLRFLIVFLLYILHLHRFLYSCEPSCFVLLFLWFYSVFRFRFLRFNSLFRLLKNLFEIMLSDLLFSDRTT
ncbi:hypothetical protein SLEP1_g11828 [Rubroshorea leprosula]|nr:hypothetical protein SLEP1_g11828 [Rubroshorea leprosula]